MMNSLEYIEKNKTRFLNELFDLLKQPSISANPKYKEDVFKTATMVQENLEKIGMEKAQLYDTAGYPIVYAEKIIDPSFSIDIQKSLLFIFKKVIVFFII